MKKTQNSFLQQKEHALKLLQKADTAGEVDSEIKDILNLINASPWYCTLSSCSGRIVILEIPSLGDKKKARFLGRWHRTIQVDEALGAVDKHTTGLLWFLAQAPILHVESENLKKANEFIHLCISCGLKNTMMKSTEKRIIIEVASTERLDAPLGQDGHIFSSPDYIQLLVNISNEIIIKSLKKLRKLGVAFQCYLK